MVHISHGHGPAADSRGRLTSTATRALVHSLPPPDVDRKREFTGTRLVVDGAEIDNRGAVRTGVIARGGANVIVKNSRIHTHEGVLPADYQPGRRRGRVGPGAGRPVPHPDRRRHTDRPHPGHHLYRRAHPHPCLSAASTIRSATGFGSSLFASVALTE